MHDRAECFYHLLSDFEQLIVCQRDLVQSTDTVQRQDVPIEPIGRRARQPPAGGMTCPQDVRHAPSTSGPYVRPRLLRRRCRSRSPPSSPIKYFRLYPVTVIMSPNIRPFSLRLAVLYFPRINLRYFSLSSIAISSLVDMLPPVRFLNEGTIPTSVRLYVRECGHLTRDGKRGTILLRLG